MNILAAVSSYIEDGNGNGDFDRRRSAYFKRHSASSSYLYSVVLEVSPILNKPMDLEGFMGLNIVFLSTLGSSIRNSRCNVGVSVSKCLCNFFF